MNFLKKLQTGLAVFALLVIPFANTHSAAAVGWEVTSDTPISVSPTGQLGDQSSFTPNMTPNGRYVTFTTSSSNLIDPAPPFYANQTYLLDRQTGTKEIVSRNSNGELGDRDSYSQGMSHDGRYILLASRATNMDNYDPGPNEHAVYLRDRQTGTTTLISSRTQFTYTHYHPISADGTRMVYSATEAPNGQAGVYLHDRTTNQTTTVMYGNGFGSVSDDGQFVHYFTFTPPSFQNTEVYRYEVASGQTTLVMSTTNISDPVFSPDGTLVAYFQTENGIPNLYIKNIATGDTTLIYAGTGESNGSPDISFSTDNHFLSFPVKTANTPERTQTELWIADLTTGQQLQASPTAYRDGFAKLNSNGSLLVYTPNVSNADNRQVHLATISLASNDTTAPTLGTPTWVNNPKSVSQTAHLTVPASDDIAVTGAEYFIGDTDPGQGNGATMQLVSGTVATTFDTSFSTGVYKINVRAQDAAGNWSTVVSDYLVVYDPTAFRMTGKRSIVPSLANNDILPGLNTHGQTDKATFAFSVRYNNQGQIHQNSDLQFSYKTGTHCNGNNPSNCHMLSLNATTITWLTTQGDNNSTGIFQGTGEVTVDGTTSPVLFRVTGIDGERLSPTATDQFQLHIFNPTDNPNTDSPLFRVNSADIARGNIKIL